MSCLLAGCGRTPSSKLRGPLVRVMQAGERGEDAVSRRSFAVHERRAGSSSATLGDSGGRARASDAIEDRPRNLRAQVVGRPPFISDTPVATLAAEEFATGGDEAVLDW